MKTKEEIAEKIGVTPVYIDEKIDFLENNGFLVRQAGGEFATYVRFEPETYSLKQWENHLKKKLEIANVLAGDYVKEVLATISDVKDVYIPSKEGLGNPKPSFMSHTLRAVTFISQQPSLSYCKVPAACQP